MDPLTAFSLACNVIQVVDFSMKVVVKCREIYKDGTSSGHKEIESMAKHLTDLFTDLDSASAVPNPGPMPRLYHDDQDLRNLAQQCSETAKELTAELQKLSIQGRPRKRDIVRMTVKVVLKKSAIEDIARRLEQYRRTLDTRILINLRQHVHLVSREQSDGLRDLDRKLQNLITGLSKDQNTFDELKNFIQAENASKKQHFSQELERHRELVAAEDTYKRLLDSLFFPDIHARQEGIKDAHKETFEWIFDKPGNEVRPWHNFINWLEEGSATYWISGKAGSGKSTLMKFICQDPRTEAALRSWSGSNEVFITIFYFWSPGSQLQKSLAGLLRSLIYHIMDRFRDLMPILTSSMGSAQYRLQQLPTWTEHRLCATLQHLLSDGLEKHRLCIFIDGLDEFDGDYNILLDLVRYLRQSTKVKFCLSSRPYQAFEDEFGSSAMLKLQDLTEPDIRRYVSEKLDRAPLKVSKVSHPWFNLGDTANMIVYRAKGVFLWVNLAVRDQLEGIRNGDDAEQLRQRLELLPEKIEELYGHMLQKIDKVYQKEVAHYLQLVLRNEYASLFTIALAVHKRIDEIVLFSPDIAISDIRNHCGFTGTRIATTCKGFLELQERSDLHEWQKKVNGPSKAGTLEHDFSRLLEERKAPLEQREDLIETKFYQLNRRVHFLHRTAVDFFKDNEQGRKFLEGNAPIHPHPRTLIFKAGLARLTVFPVPTKDEKVRNPIRDIMLEAFDAEEETGVAQVALMDLLDRSLAMLCQRSGQPSDLHWCRAWGFPDTFGPSDSSSSLKSKTQHTSEPSNDGILTPYPVDFLGFAAYFGLHKYVEHILDLQSGRQNTSIADYLLSCAVDGFRVKYRMEATKSYMKLISALLKRGANPNMKSLESTVWGSFLRKLYDLYYWDGSSYGKASEILQLVFLDTVREFIGSGANVNETFCLILDETVDPQFRSGTLIPSSVESYRISLQISSLSILQQFFAKIPILSEIEDACITSGALSYFECTEISFSVFMGEDFRWVDSRLSEQQLRQFSHALDQRLREFAGDFGKKLHTFERQIVELFQELDIELLYEQVRREKEHQGLPNQEQKSQEKESSDDIERTSDESNIHAPESHTEEGPSHSTHTSQVEPLPLRTRNDD